VRWRKAGIWDKLLAAVSEAYNGKVQMIDSSVVRVHQHVANGEKKSGRSRCMGRSRGGLTTKIHALVDACGLPIALKLSEGQAHDGKGAEDMLGALPRKCVVLADRGYDSDAPRAMIAAQGAAANIRPLDIASIRQPSARASTSDATSSSAFSTRSSITAPSPPASTSTAPTSSPR
jgi:transposase